MKRTREDCKVKYTVKGRKGKKRSRRKVERREGIERKGKERKEGK
jgi:hypothetical protein